MKKFFVIVSAVIVCLVSGCTLPPERDPPTNYSVHMSNRTPPPLKLRFIENGYTKEGFVYPNQTKIFNMTVGTWREDIVYKIVALRPGRTGNEEVVATAEIRITVQAESDYSVKSRIFSISYEGGTKLNVEEESRGFSSPGYFGF